MVPLKKEIPVNFNKLVGFVFPKREKYNNEKVMFYIRLYTDLIRAEDSISKEKYKKMVNYLRVVRNMAKSSPFKEEEAYLKRIYDIVSGILSNIRCAACKGNDCSVCNPAHAKTKMQLAQNICILRILKRNSR